MQVEYSSDWMNRLYFFIAAQIAQVAWLISIA